MKNDLRILMIEDAPADAELVERELLEGGLSFRFQRVETKEEFLRQLAQDPPDLILSDHGLPSFDGFSALALARGNCPEVPFIFVTGAMGEETTIQTFERGATDYVLKHHLFKLVPAVQRALREVEHRRTLQLAGPDRHQLLQDLHRLLSEVTALNGLLPICAACKKIRDTEGNWIALEVFLRERFNLTLTHGICPECVAQAGFGSPPAGR
jgi:CheY-like chemotaxis protein